MNLLTFNRIALAERGARGMLFWRHALTILFWLSVAAFERCQVLYICILRALSGGTEAI